MINQFSSLHIDYRLRHGNLPTVLDRTASDLTTTHYGTRLMTNSSRRKALTCAPIARRVWLVALEALELYLPFEGSAKPGS